LKNFVVKITQFSYLVKAKLKQFQKFSKP